jgi:hypothetical protein
MATPNPPDPTSSRPLQPLPNEDDIFSAALTLEDTAYATGHAQGLADGERAGRAEGRLFGLTHGFDKYLEIGRLQGRTDVWSKRVTGQQSGNDKLRGNLRVKRHVDSLLELTDPAHSPAVNDEEAVDAFEERVKRARAKVKMVEKILGEEVEGEGLKGETESNGQEKDMGVNMARAQNANLERNIEDM